ncbi:hypothetical protein CHARACLAT_026829 [Characodon lateralis]|uniref:Transmembrane protein 67 n=1 Tax=Characodon lateralis TaxID=208331 RepID=A0ABU7EEL0_9TELE|nr:hypothetical protein [Characodon lateralis]
MGSKGGPLFTMATETLLLFSRHRFLAYLLFVLYRNLADCQQFIIPFKSPSDCGADEFFDISSLSCSRCGSNQRQSSTGFSCICQPGYRTTNVIPDKVSITCEQCPTNRPAVTKDGFGCVRCPGTLSDEGKCQCPPGHILVERDINGNPLNEARCEACNSNSPALSLADIRGDRCERCTSTFINSSCVCTAPNVPAGGLCFPSGILSTNVNPSVNYAQLKFSVQSAWFVANLYSSSAACLVYSNLTACQALGNMCVMNMHSFGGLSADACGLFNTVYRSKAALSSVQDIAYWKVDLPWLFYGDEPGLASRVLQTDPVPTVFSFRGRNKNTVIELLAAIYDVRGEFLRWEQVGGSNLQIAAHRASNQIKFVHPALGCFLWVAVED